jgi:hypothetical protein
MRRARGSKPAPSPPPPPPLQLKFQQRGAKQARATFPAIYCVNQCATAAYRASRAAHSLQICCINQQAWVQSLGLYEKSSPSPSAAGAAPDLPSSSLCWSSSLLCFSPEGAGAAAASGAQHTLMVSMMAILSADSLVDQSSSSPCSAASARLCAIRVHYDKFDSAFTSTTMA